MSTDIHFSITEKGRELVLEGPLDLFQKFLSILEHNDQSIPRPETIGSESGPALEAKAKCQDKA